MARYTPNIFSFMRLECELLALKLKQKVSYSCSNETIKLEKNGLYYVEIRYSTADDVMETSFFKLYMFRGIKHRAFAKTVFVPVNSGVFANVWIDIRNYLEVFFSECVYS